MDNIDIARIFTVTLFGQFLFYTWIYTCFPKKEDNKKNESLVKMKPIRCINSTITISNRMDCSEYVIEQLSKRITMSNRTIDVNQLLNNKTDNIICDSTLFITREIIDNTWNHTSTDENEEVHIFDNASIIYNSTIHICKDLHVLNDNEEYESDHEENEEN